MCFKRWFNRRSKKSVHRYQVSRKVNTSSWIFVAMRKNPIILWVTCVAYCFIGVISAGKDEWKDQSVRPGVGFEGAFDFIYRLSTSWLKFDSLTLWKTRASKPVNVIGRLCERTHARLRESSIWSTSECNGGLGSNNKFNNYKNKNISSLQICWRARNI